MGTIAVLGHAVAIDLILFLLSTLVWVGIAIRMAGPGANGMRTMLLGILALGVLAARSMYVVAHGESYRAAPWKVLAVSDGGFIVFAGFLAAALATLWFGWRRRSLLRPLVTALAGGLFAWSIGLHLLWLVRTDAPRLPEVTLSTLGGHPIAMSDFSGRPLVVNLWASWCAPCRRELPVLREAQLAEKGVVFVFADQGESAATVRAYLDQQHLSLRNVLMDPLGSLAVHAESSAVPTTLFFDENGMLVKAHAGQLSAEELRRYLGVLRPHARGASPRERPIHRMQAEVEPGVAEEANGCWNWQPSAGAFRLCAARKHVRGVSIRLSNLTMAAATLIGSHDPSVLVVQHTSFGLSAQILSAVSGSPKKKPW